MIGDGHGGGMPSKLLDTADVGSSSIDRPRQSKMSECGMIMSATSTSVVDGSNRMGQVEHPAAPPEDIITPRNDPGEIMVNTPNSFEALQAVATTTASTASTAISRPSSGKTSPSTDRKSSLGSLRGEVFLSQPRPPSETVSKRKMGSRRGMAALNVAGTRRSWLWPPVTMSQLATPDDLDNKGAPSDGANESAEALTPAPTSGPHLLRIYSDPSTASDRESAVIMSNSIAHQSHEDGGEASEVCAEAEISPSTSSSSSPSSGSTSTSPEREGFIRARDSIGVTVRRSVSRNSGGGEAGGDADSSKQSTAPIGIIDAQQANKSTTTWTRRSWSMSVPGKRASMPIVSHARGSSAMTFRESLTQPRVCETAVVANGAPSGGATGSITDSRVKQQARGWRVKAAQESPRAHGAGAKRGILGGRSSSGSGSSSKETANISPGTMRVENKELRLSSRRLEKALALAKVSSTGPRHTKHLHFESSTVRLPILALVTTHTNTKHDIFPSKNLRKIKIIAGWFFFRQHCMS